MYSQQGPVQKKVGALHLGRQTLFFLEKTGDLFSHHRMCVRCQFSKTGDPFLLITLVHSGVAHYFRHAKNCRSFCGGLFCGGPVRPNILNMP